MQTLTTQAEQAQRDAEQEAARVRAQAERTQRDAEKEAADIRAQAQADAAHVRAQAEQTQRDAEQEAGYIKSKANRRANEIVNDAQEKAHDIISSARADAQRQAQHIINQALQHLREREEELEKKIKEYTTKCAALANGFSRKAVNYLSRLVAIETIAPYVGGADRAEEIFDAQREELLTQLSKGDIWKGKDPLSPEQKQALDNETVGEHEQAEQQANEATKQKLAAIYRNQQNKQSSRGYSREYGSW